MKRQILNRRHIVQEWKSTPWRGLLCFVLIFWASQAGAQFSQYTSPSEFQDDFATMEKLLEEAMAEARWRRGPLLIDPWIGLREATYDDNVGNRPRDPILSDYLVTIGAGLRGYLPVGQNLVVAGHVLPEYTYWFDLSDRRKLNGRYGIGLFGSTGPVAIELTAQRVDDTRFFSREFEDRVDVSENYSQLDLEVNVAGGFAVFGGFGLAQYGFSEDEIGVDPAVGILDRDEQVGRLGVRFRPRGNLMLAIGVESSDVEFDLDDRRSNSGVSPMVQVDFEGARSNFTADLAFRDLEAEGAASIFPGYDELTGRMRATWQLSPPLQLEVLGYRNLVYSFQDSFAFFEDQAVGVGLRTSLGSRAGLWLRLENGSDDYVPFVETATARSDDFDSVSGELQVELGPFTLVINGSRTEYDSNLLQFDRTVTTVTTGLIFGQRTRSPWG